MSKKRSRATRQADAKRASERAAAIRKAQESKERRRRTLVVSAVVVVLLALILGIGLGVQANRDTSGQAATAPHGAVDTYAVPAGKADAPVTLTIYEDFMCPYCGDFEAGSRSALQKYVDDGDLRIKYHVISIIDSSTDYSTRAGGAFAAVLDAAGPAVAEKFHDLLFEHQPEEGSAGLSNAELVGYAVQAGAPKAAVAAAIDDGTYEQWVTNGTDAASKNGIRTTPTVLLDDKELEGSSIDGLVSAVQNGIAAKL